MLPERAAVLAPKLGFESRVALVFGPEKHGLTRDDLSYCHALIEIPTDPRQPSMNLGQAVAVCLYELSRQIVPSSPGAEVGPDSNSGTLDRLAGLIEETMVAAGYSPRAMRPANRHDLRLLLRRLAPSSLDTRRMLGLFRRVLYRLQNPGDPLH